MQTTLLKLSLFCPEFSYIAKEKGLVEGMPVLQKGQPVILDQHLKAALSEASPSLPRKELEAMNQVYARFRSSREAGVGNKDAKGKGSMRTTLA